MVLWNAQEHSTTNDSRNVPYSYGRKVYNQTQQVLLKHKVHYCAKHKYSYS